jgi:triphosphoribosyl-dephospho-CoA synthase
LIGTDELRMANWIANRLPASEKAVRAASLIAEYASAALQTELMLTPKPGLVDRRNSGAHQDMNITMFLKSARVLSAWFPRFVEIGYDAVHVPACDFLPLLRNVGVLCENEMFKATRGVNTHKGAIFSLGLLCAAAGRLLANGRGLNRERICAEVASICLGLVSRELSARRTADTAGERIFQLYGLAGARGEAASGYWTVRSVALPVFDRLRSRGVNEQKALLQVLLHLLAVNGDTNLVSRGGLGGLDYVREHARKLLVEGGVFARDGLKRLAAFDDELVARNLSPGGSADLLAVTALLVRFPAEHPILEPNALTRPDEVEREICF